MNKIIFGSGLPGLIAKEILGPEWTIVPFNRSRFFSFSPALDDNFIIADEATDDFAKTLGSTTKYPYKIAWSNGGTIISHFDKSSCDNWIDKVFGNNDPGHILPYMANRMQFEIYDIRCNSLYDNLMKSQIDYLRKEHSLGMPTEVGDHYFIRGGKRVDFDYAVSTIPLPALCALMKIDVKLPSKDVHFLHLETGDLDFEGNDQLLVADMLFDFFKAVRIFKNRYLFYLNNDIPNPGIYFMPFIDKFDIIDGTVVRDAIPLGPVPELPTIEKFGICCVGSYAQWDWAMDIGSCISRLLKYASQNFDSKIGKFK